MRKENDMKLRDFIKIEQDTDIYDDVYDGIGCCFCGALRLKPEGKKRYADILDLDIEMVGNCEALIHIDDPDAETVKRRYRLAKDFFWSAAGYCADDDWHKWFYEQDMTYHANR